jgi:beta-phosphoglucomutase
MRDDRGLRAVLWDLDGTLLDSTECHWSAWREIMGEQGRDVTYDDFIATYGQRNDYVLRRMIGPHLTPDEIGRLGAAKEERYRALLRTRGIQLLPGAEQWLRALQAAGWRQALASSAPWSNIAMIINAPALRDLLDAVVSGGDARHGKPAPDTFLLAAEKVGVPPAQCVVVEDSPAGVEGARRAGMRCIGVGPSHLTLPADVKVHSLLDLPADAFDRLLDL